LFLVQTERKRKERRRKEVSDEGRGRGKNREIERRELTLNDDTGHPFGNSLDETGGLLDVSSLSSLVDGVWRRRGGKKNQLEVPDRDEREMATKNALKGLKSMSLTPAREASGPPAH